MKSGVHGVSDNGETHQLEKIVKHHDYKSFLRYNDICLMQLKLRIHRQFKSSVFSYGNSQRHSKLECPDSR